MALMHPMEFPHDLTRKPKLKGEALVFDALRAGLPDGDYAARGWQVFYDRRIPGSRRRVDFIAVCIDRGLVAIEVKGGQVHDKRGSFRQLISRTPVMRKRIDPFGQLKLGLRDLFAAAGVSIDSVPLHQAIWFPEMGQGGLRWEASPHILTREVLEGAKLHQLVEASLARVTTAAERAAIKGVSGVLSITS